MVGAGACGQSVDGVVKVFAGGELNTRLDLGPF